jgi:myo-inositol 2-dehydrogenase/D-chiro-inositol 1-dehydrogenase
MSERFQVAIFGAGRMGQIHGRNAAANPALRLKYVVDQSSGAAGALAGACSAEVGDLDRVMADPEITGVIVASSTDTHLELSLRALGAGKAVFCEKPIDLDLGKTRAAADRLGGADMPLFVAFNRRFDPHFRELKSKLDAGAVGRLESVNITNHDPASPPADFVPRSGGLFKDFTIHDFDMARWLLGEEPCEVFASASCLVDPEIGRQGDVDTARTLLKTASGRLCMISNTRRSGCGYDQRVEAFGAQGMARVGNVAQSEVEVWREPGAAGAPIDFGFVDRYRLSYRNEMDHFAEVLAGRVRPLTGYADSLRALELAEAALESSRTGAAVRL